ncbi:MAG: glycosyltransferase family 9 protein [Deltaproteobacteria bacterium]|jgi:ADP-heptose:LPS heptosyltransferase|nr:glycosyltransferase family 9 protein [Deltaproteobacteria bacterium]
MKINFQRKIDRYIGAFICRILSLFYRKSRDEDDGFQPKKFLVILLSEMGSIVLAYPMFQQIKKRYPGAEIYGLLFDKNKEILMLLDVTPVENILTIRDTTFGAFAVDCLRALNQIRKLKIDVVIDCELFARISSIISFLSGARIRVGFHPHTQEGLYRGTFINRPVLFNPYHHISRQFLNLVSAIDSVSMPMVKQAARHNNLKAPAIEFTQPEIEAMQTRLRTDFRAIDGKKLILIYPGGGILPIRAWPRHYYSQVAGELIKKGYAVGIVGLATDKELAAAILSDCNHPACIDLTGYTRTVRELMLIFQFAKLLITNDGGPGQFAALTPVPTIIFYGPETPDLYGPIDDKAALFYNPLPCSPCLSAYNHRNSPCDGDNLCLKQIPPQQVLKNALQILEGGRTTGG